MSALPVEWVLVIFYGPAAHRATYGRLGRSNSANNTYTKDYIQLSRKDELSAALKRCFPGINDNSPAPLTYKWPTGTATGALVLRSADRPHLKWETSIGAPQVWKMSVEPSEGTAETIPGDPSHLDTAAADNEFALLASRGAGQPYLIAVKLLDDPGALHLRAYLADPSAEYAWADMQLVPQDIQNLAANTSRNSALAWSTITSGGVALDAEVNDALVQLTASENPVSVIDALDVEVASALATYLRSPGYGLFFDPARNHDAWLQAAPLDEQFAASANVFLEMLEARFPMVPQGDAAAETLEVSAEEVDAFRDQIEHENYEVADSHATVKTRGSAQRAFAEAVKTNYGYQCAITGIESRDFLVASHIVPWSVDQSIRLDPSNGICLSLLVDRAFEKGYLIIKDDLTAWIDWEKVGNDEALREQLLPYDEQKLSVPEEQSPKLIYLQRRRALINPGD
ncbi:hypothetical protein ABIA60_000224 [Pseudomonas frederiksbergensis]